MYESDEACFYKKIVSSCILCFTIILLLFNIVNEYTYVNYSKELRPLVKNAIPVSCIPLEENNGKLVHINCPLQELETFYPPSEFSANLYSFHGVFFETKVEMFQWVRDRENLGLFPRGKFMDHIVPTPYNFLFFFKRRQNPSAMPFIGNVGIRYANYVKVGNYRLSGRTLINFQKKKKIDLIDDGYFTESDVKPPFRIDHLNTKIHNNYMYTGDPSKPQIGDVRISFYGSTATHATVIGMQKSRFMNTIFELDGMDIMNQNIILLSEDNISMTSHINYFIHKNYGNITSLWFLRLLTSILITIQTFLFIDNDTRNLLWKACVSLLSTIIVMSIFPCIFWFFCDGVVFLSLFVFIFFMLVALVFLFNVEVDDGYTEMKNYMKRSGAVTGVTTGDPSNYTFLNISGKYGDDIYDDEYNYHRNEANNAFNSSSELSYIQPAGSKSGRHPESSPVYGYSKK